MTFVPLSQQRILKSISINKRKFTRIYVICLVKQKRSEKIKSSITPVHNFWCMVWQFFHDHTHQYLQLGFYMVNLDNLPDPVSDNQLQ